MGKKNSKSPVFEKIRFFSIFKFILLSISFFLVLLEHHFKINEIKSFKGTLIPELSDEPILIEKVTKDLIVKERNKLNFNFH